MTETQPGFIDPGAESPQNSGSASNNNGIVLRAENLVKLYKKRAVVKDVSVEVKQGEIVGLLGPNGAGKTTTFYMIVGMIRPNGGHVYLEEKDITRLPMYKRAHAGIGYFPQEPSVFRTMTVRENVLAVLQMTKLSTAEQAERCDTLLREFGLTHLSKSKGYVLSGGETAKDGNRPCAGY